MGDLKVLVRCKDCGKQRTIEPVSQIIPLVEHYSCLSDGDESTKKKCSCGCESFFVLGIIEE